MVLKSDQERVKALLSETITLLCRNGLHFQSELSIEALIGITLDHDDVFLVSVKEIIQPNSNSVDSPNSVDAPRKQKQEDVRAIQLDAEPGDLSDSTHAGTGTSLTHSAGQQLMFYPDNVAGEKVPEAQKKKRCRTIDANSDGRAIKSAKPADGHTFSRSRVEAQTGGDVIVEGASSLSELDRAGTHTTQSDGNEVFVPHEEAGAKSDIFGEDFGADVIHIKEEAFSVDDGGMQYYNPSASFSAYPPSQYQGMTNDANPFDAAGHAFQVSEESAAHLVNEMHSQGSNSSSLSVDTLVVAAKSQLQVAATADPRRHAPSSFAAAALGQPQRCYRCQMCGTTIGDLNGYKEHIKRHRNIYKYYCNVCGKGFSASINLRGHLVKHTGVKEFRCSLCPKDFAYKRQLERHLISAHPEAAAVVALQASTSSSSVPFVSS